MYIDPHKINLQDAAGMQLVELIRKLGDEIGSLPYDETPAMAGAGSAGESVEYARGDHQHPSDTSKLDVSDGERIENEALNAYPVNGSQGGVVSFDDGSGLKANEVIVGIVPVQSGSGDPAPDNVRPISGWNGAIISSCGKNLISHYNEDLPKTAGGVTFSRSGNNYIVDVSEDKTGYPYARICQLPCIKAGTYYLNSTPSTSGISMRIIDRTVNPFVTVNRTSPSFVVENDINHPVDVEIAISSSEIAVGTYTIKCELVIGSVSGDYHLYDGSIIPISFGTDAGTIYGGSINVTTGVLRVTHVKHAITSSDADAMADYATAYGYYINGEVYFDPPMASGTFYSDIKSISNTFPKRNNNSGFGIWIGVDSPRVYFCHVTDTIPEIASASDFCEWCETNGAYFTYPLASPIIYQLTPIEVELLAGYNAMWCDTGDISVEYKADTTAFVNNAVNSLANILEKIITANIETEMKATKNYTTNDLIIANGNLYKASSNIASGATLAVGTNVTATTIAAELASISVGG